MFIFGKNRTSVDPNRTFEIKRQGTPSGVLPESLSRLLGRRGFVVGGPPTGSDPLLPALFLVEGGAGRLRRRARRGRPVRTVSPDRRDSLPGVN